MTVSGVSGNTPIVGTPQIPAAKPNQGNTAQPTSTQPKRDTVKLTGKALAKSLKLAGQTPAQIAKDMSVDVKTVDSYLGIQTTAAITMAAPKPVVAAATPSTATPAAASPAAKVDTKV